MKLTTEERLSAQLMDLTAASTDLRALQGQPELRAFIKDLRALRNRAFQLLPFVSDGHIEWAKERLRVRAGLSGNTWWAPGQRLEDHTQESDLRLLLEWLDAIR